MGTPSRSLRLRAGALLYDWPRFERAMRGAWIGMRNRNERLTFDGRGARCEWIFTSDLHIAKVFPSAGARLMARAFRDWPIELRDTRETSDAPEVSFIIGHRGMQRLPHLLATLRSIAGQRDAAIECIVVEQSVAPEARGSLPSWVRHIHTPLPAPDYPFNRSWAFNAGAREARGRLLIFHDNDMLCPARYAAEIVARANEGSSFFELKRFIFYLGETASRAMFATGVLPTDAPDVIVQNLQGGSVAAEREAFFAIGGFDESFVGWGGEDNEFWERAASTGRVYDFGYLPIVHLWHAPQPGKVGQTAPAIRRYQELTKISPQERIAALRTRSWGSLVRPDDSR
jgi:hypothetical protein